MFDQKHQDCFIPKPKTSYSADFNVVALCFYLYIEGFETHRIGSILSNVNDKFQFPGSIVEEKFKQAEHLAQSAADYFSKKLVMRTLNDKPVSAWDKKIERIMSNPTKLEFTEIPVYSTLPQIYEDNLAEDAVMQQAVSYDSPRKAVIQPTRLRYLDSTNLRGMGHRGKQHFFISERGHVFYVTCNDRSTPGASFISAFARSGISFVAEGRFNCHVYPGYDKKVLEFRNMPVTITDIKVESHED